MTSVLECLPWRFRYLLGDRDPAEDPHVSWRKLGFDTLQRDGLWEQFGHGMNLFTLEFPNAGLEKSYVMDWTRRLCASKIHRCWNAVLAICCSFIVAYVRYACLNDSLSEAKIMGDYVRSTVLCYGKTDSISYWSVLVASPELIIILSGIITGGLSIYFRDGSSWFITNHALIHWILAFITGIIAMMWVYVAPFVFPFYCWSIEDTFDTVLIIYCLGTCYHLRFVHFFYVAIFFLLVEYTVHYPLLYLSPDPRMKSGYFSQPGENIAFTIFCTGILLVVKYMYGRLLRKDYVLGVTLANETERSEKLLLNVLPETIVASIKARGFDHIFPSGLAQRFDQVTIVFSDVVAFTNMTSRMRPEDLVALLNDLFTLFDDIAEDYGLEKIKTCGDAYMAACGLPTPNPQHAHCGCRMALAMKEGIPERGIRDDHGNPLALRIGVATGTCVAGILGGSNFIYDVWGEGVTTAHLMESTGDPKRVHISCRTAKIVYQDFDLRPGPVVQMRDGTPLDTFFLMKELSWSRARERRLMGASLRKTRSSGRRSQCTVTPL
ncbi:hypothetical protein FOZ61_000491 [Perkinsus olseni]|uniref:Guanylate cyclase domain-containing protein n=1 Tax=Perkinsus olseni TaxID=32597 RepID=A0A7J6LZQ7_PEROL|nr:hypothetical protein FOZ61_000491 [Perkinsus olseni]